MRKFGLAAVIFTLMFLAGFGLAGVESRSQPEVHRAQVALGTVVEVQVRGLSAEAANRAIEAAFAEIRRVETLLESHTFFSAGIHQPPAEINALLLACDQAWRVSAGAFDCSLGPLAAAWGFAGGQLAVPGSDTLAQALAESGWHAFQRNGEGAWLLARNASLNYGGVGKGYAVDRAVAVLEAHGVRQGLVNAGGDLRVIGGPWTAGIQHPRQPGKLAGRLQFDTLAVATSGDYEQYFIEDGIRYHHILDPHSGYPAGGFQSVTVLAPTCQQADVLATGLFVLGLEPGMTLVESLAAVEAYWIDSSGETHLSSGFADYWQDK